MRAKKLKRPRYSASPSANWAIKVCEPDQANCSALPLMTGAGVQSAEHRLAPRGLLPARLNHRINFRSGVAFWLTPHSTLRPTLEGCVKAYYLQRTRFEGLAERKIRRRQLTEDGNVEISGRDLR